MKKLILLFMLVPVLLPAQSYDEYRDTLVVHNAILTGLSSSASDTTLVISGDTVYRRVGSSVSFVQDTFFVGYMCDSTVGGWVYSGDTIFVDTCGSNSFGKALWQVDGAFLLPSNLGHSIGVGNKNNYIFNDFSEGLNLVGHPNYIHFAIANAKKLQLTNSGGDKLQPYTDDALDLGSSSKEWRNGYFDGTLQTDILRVDLTVQSSLAPYSNNNYDIGTTALRWRDGWFARDLTASGDLSIGDDAYIADSTSLGTTIKEGALTVKSEGNGSDSINAINVLGVTDNTLSLIIGGESGSAFLSVPEDGTFFFNEFDANKATSSTLMGINSSNIRTYTHVLPHLNNTYNFGSSSYRFKDGYFDGKIYGRTLQLTTGATNGYYLKSDASGNASWGAAPSQHWTTYDTIKLKPTDNDYKGLYFESKRVSATQNSGMGLIFSRDPDVGCVGCDWILREDYTYTNTLSNDAATAVIHSTAYSRGKIEFRVTPEADSTQMYIGYNPDLSYASTGLLGYTSPGVKVKDNLQVGGIVRVGDMIELIPMDTLPAYWIDGAIINHNDTLKFYNGTAWKTITY